MPPSHTARLSSCLLFTALMLQGAACLPAIELENLAADTYFNEKIRPDLQALTDTQQSDLPWVEVDGEAYFSDGGPDGDELVSELYHSMIPPERLRELRKSRCLFVEGGGFPVLSFEVVATNLDVGDHELSTDKVGMCSGYLNDPVTRAPLEIDGRGAGFEINIEAAGAGLLAHSGNEADRNPYGACDEVLPSESTNLTHGRDLLGGTDGTYKPFCLLRGGPPDVPAEDTSYVLDVVDTTTGENISTTYPSYTTSPRAVLPHLKVVLGRRTIARPLTFAGSEFDVERNRWVHTFAWAVENVDENGNPDPAGAFWRENYGPSVLVESAAFFVQNGGAPAPEGSPDREYVAIDKLRVTEIEGVTAFDSGCDLEDAGDPDGDGSLYLSPCEITATPAYALAPDVNGRMTRKLEWRAQFFTEDELDPIPVGPSEPFFVEFRLQAPIFGSQSGALMVDPGHASIPSAPIGTTLREVAALAIESIGAAGVLVDDIQILGPDASVFDFELPHGTELPFVLPSGRGIELDLLVEATRWGWHEAELVVSWSDAGQQQADARAPIRAYGVAPDLEVLPRVVSLKRGDAAADPDAHLRNVLVTNFGNATLERRTIDVAGSDHGFFTVIRSECQGKISSPPAARCSLPPRGMELLTVMYHPLVPGLHDARLALDTNAGSDEVALVGSCSGFCSYGVPTPGWEKETPEARIGLDDDFTREVEAAPTPSTTTTLVLEPKLWTTKIEPVPTKTTTDPVEPKASAVGGTGGTTLKLPPLTPRFTTMKRSFR